MTKKKSSMQKEVEKGEQMDLIDVGPKAKKEIEKVGRAYRAKVDARLALQKGRGGEEELQQRLLALVKAENLTRDNDGKVKFTVGDVEFELAPTKEKVKVKIKED